MNLSEMAELFEKHNEEFLHFERVISRKSNRPDINGFLFLEELIPTQDNSDIISGAEHDLARLEIDAEELAEAINEDGIVHLLRCGILYDERYESLYIFT